MHVIVHAHIQHFKEKFVNTGEFRLDVHIYNLYTYLSTIELKDFRVLTPLTVPNQHSFVGISSKCKLLV